jgi:hypothetical protein
MDRQYGHVIGNPSDYGGMEYAPQPMMVRSGGRREGLLGGMHGPHAIFVALAGLGAGTEHDAGGEHPGSAAHHGGVGVGINAHARLRYVHTATTVGVCEGGGT